MTFQLTDLLQEFYKRMGQMNAGYATGGSTSTIVDSFRNGEGSDKGWRGGSAFVVKTTDGLAPQGEFSRVSTSASGTWTLTLSPVLTAVVGAGDIYGFSGPEYPLYDMILLATSALRKLGPLDYSDITSITPVSGDSEYAASAEWKYPYGPIAYDVATNNDSGDYQWQSYRDAYWDPGIGGAAGKIIFPTHPDGDVVRIWYRGPHPAVTAYSDVIDGRFEREVVIQALVTAALDWNNSRIRGGDKFLLGRANKAEQDLIMAKAETPIERKPVKSKLLTLRGNGTRYPGDRNPL